MKYIDLTHTFRDKIPVYPGDPQPELRQIASIEKDGCTDHLITTAMHVGTHMDGPMHMIKGGKKISDFPPEKFFGNGVLIDIRSKTSIDTHSIFKNTIASGDIVLFWTDWSKKFGTEEYYAGYPLFSQDLAQTLVDRGVSIIGLDTPSPDVPPFAVHKILLQKEILIIENLENLDQLHNQLFEIIALPAKFRTDSAPCRVIARVVQ